MLNYRLILGKYYNKFWTYFCIFFHYTSYLISLFLSYFFLTKLLNNQSLTNDDYIFWLVLGFIGPLFVIPLWWWIITETWVWFPWSKNIKKIGLKK